MVIRESATQPGPVVNSLSNRYLARRSLRYLPAYDIFITFTMLMSAIRDTPSILMNLTRLSGVPSSPHRRHFFSIKRDLWSAREEACRKRVTSVASAI